MTVIVAEHRLERVVQYADKIIEVSADGTVSCGDPARMLRSSLVAPPVVELGRLEEPYFLPLSLATPLIRGSATRSTRVRPGPIAAPVVF